MNSYIDYENQVIFMLYDGCADSVENNAIILGQLRILGFIEIQRKIWKLEVPSKEVFNFIVLQINTTMKPRVLSSSVIAFCKAVDEYKNSKSTEEASQVCCIPTPESSIRVRRSRN